MKLRYTPTAFAQFSAVLDYIATHSPEGAQRVQARIQKMTALLTRHPLLGRPTDTLPIRRVNVSPYPYIIFYEAAKDEIIIHGIRHDARGPSAEN